MTKEVKVYSTTTCPYCVRAKQFLKENNIVFEDIDVSANPEAGEEMIKKSGQMGVPVLDIGGQTAVSGEIENYTGYQFITGPELTQKFEEHLRQFGIPLKENEGVTGIKKINNNSFQVVTDKANYEAKTVIIASGKRSRELNVPGEKEFKNKGLTYCATCDAPLFSGKNVAVIGGGNSGLDATLQLMKIAKFIYLINIAPALTGDPIMEEKVLESKMVKVLNSTQVTAVLGDKMVNAIKIKRESKEETLPDVTNVPEKQIIIAAGEGSKACLTVFRYLAQQK